MSEISIAIGGLALFTTVATLLASKSFEHGKQIARNEETILNLKEKVRRLERHAGFTNS